MNKVCVGFIRCSNEFYCIGKDDEQGWQEADTIFLGADNFTGAEPSEEDIILFQEWLNFQEWKLSRQVQHFSTTRIAKLGFPNLAPFILKPVFLKPVTSITFSLDCQAIIYHLLVEGVRPKLDFPNLVTLYRITLMNTESNNVTAAALLSNLLNANEGHHTSLLATHTAYNGKIKALEALRAAGFKSMQPGSALRYNKNAPPLKGEFSYIAAVAEFTARLLSIKPSATQKQIDDNNKQRVITLNFWLKTGKFSNSIGKDAPRLEHELSLERVDLKTVAVETTTRAATLATRQVKETKAAILKNTAALKKIDPKAGDMSANAFKIATDKAAALKIELKEANAANTKAIKAAAVAKAKLGEVNLAAKDAKDKLDLKNQAKIDVKAMAKKIGGQLTSEQIKQLIDLLQAEI